MFKRHKREALTLRRDLGLFDATLAGVGIIVGAGIYVLIGAAAGLAGNAVWLAFLISAIVAFLTGLSYAELSSIYPDASGEYSYVEHNINKQTAFVVGFLVMISLVISAAAVSLGFAGYLDTFMGLGKPLAIAIATIIIFTVVNLIGIKQSMKLNILFTVLSILGLVIVFILSLGKMGSVNYFEMPNGLTGVFKAASLIFFAYIGFESVVKLSEETKNPKKIIPLSLLLSLFISTVLYIAVAFSAISVLGWQELAASKAPLADVANTIVGGNAFIVISLIAIVSTGNTVLMGLVAMSRMLYGMAKKYETFSILTTISSHSKTPYVAVVLSGALAIIFVYIGNLQLIAEITNFIVFVIFAVVNYCLLASRFRNHPAAKFRSPFNAGKVSVSAALGMVASVLMIIHLHRIVMFYGIMITFIGYGISFFLKEAA